MRAFWLLIKTYLEFSTSGTPSASNAIWFDGTIFKKKQGGVVTDLDTGGGGGLTEQEILARTMIN